MILLIDNYDSFTYNLYQYAGEIQPDIEVYRNDALTVEEVAAKKPSHIIISPGPGYPSSAGISREIVRKLGLQTPILGVCLGHQVIAEAYGGKVIHAQQPVHGKASEIELLPGCPLFDGLPKRISAARYHSLIVERSTLPDVLQITSVADTGEIMGIRHKEYRVFGIQFHPESIMTTEGKKILRNFLSIK